MASRPVILKVLCALLVGCLLLPLGQSLFPYLNIPVLPFDVMLERAAVPATGAEPHVRSAAARNARRLVSYEVVGKGGAVIRDDRRAVVAYAARRSRRMSRRRSQGVRPLCQRNRSPGNLEFLAAELESNTTEV
jgi:hypothetical protein